MENKGYIEALRTKIKSLQEEISAERQKVRNLLENIQEKEEQAEHIIKLLELEGVTFSDGELKLAPVSVADMGYEVLKRQPTQEPIHYKKIAELIAAEGKLIPGKDPAANLVSHLGRDDRFVRTGRGMYGLREWGLEPAKTKKTQRRKGSKSKR